MRVALVSPYSWTYPGGVTAHIEALALELLAAGHEARVLAPFDADDRAAARRHGGARPQVREVPPWLTPLGPTVGWPSNGAVSNLAFFPQAVPRLRRALAEGAFDVVHVHEPVAPAVGWDVLGSARAPLVGTFHCHSEAVAPHLAAALVGARRRLNRLHVRLAVSEAAAWTGERFYGGRYRVVPNGVTLPAGGPPPARRRPAGAPLRVAFVGRAVARKGLPVLLQAFAALRQVTPARLTVIGVAPDELPAAPSLAGVTALGRVPDPVKRAALAEADVLCAPSLGGESFGMVLTEAFAAGTPVVASDIVGYRDVARDGVEGLLTPPGDVAALTGALVALAADPERAAAMGAAAARAAERYAWPRVAERVLEAYEDALAIPAPGRFGRRAATRVGLVAADGLPRVRARRIPPPGAAPPARSPVGGPVRAPEVAVSTSSRA
jgi:phosphatidylinositol alpha-mannosyltransferase